MIHKLQVSPMWSEATIEIENGRIPRPIVLDCHSSHVIQALETQSRHIWIIDGQILGKGFEGSRLKSKWAGGALIQTGVVQGEWTWIIHTFHSGNCIGDTGSTGKGGCADAYQSTRLLYR